MQSKKREERLAKSAANTCKDSVKTEGVRAMRRSEQRTTHEMSAKQLRA